MRYLLDTNTVSDFFKRHPQVMSRFQRMPPAWLAVSTVTMMEIEYGFERKPAAREKFGEVWAALLGDLHVLPYDAHDAAHTARLRAHLAAIGKPIGPFDLQLAGVALARHLTLVTHNTAEFTRVPDLLVEDWWQLLP
ncbi:type II toxin-antitoxin system VapC family toxin [Deinococcus metallilatus]|uniref:Type II toxin-antitoxin system VapC family toxin n=1 Tax=Deinococcus metallilatus TaxID=1211322 RepID=A0AAJ5F2J9_9DEIO|nr:PIN domain-containing protein [Deinococcus metallilatus]MBB5296217.1 tRNA(fMet)-specific endonuclease VapC [Deinococcus metallilatus]QBY09736.1 type II toxin-antitoxin system VapC family toxin [Deinococcus metallilatus]RXJ08934.1 type II toxin-antitoxin system VapC family toxin [Deinococcus metallilatus]TLK23687.1 type II toxin-antitoxin system VapC family toxin [Deinococcus metallilatus]GMA14083.1 pilus biogenesis protein [Deinococcus metallilatus]